MQLWFWVNQVPCVKICARYCTAHNYGKPWTHECMWVWYPMRHVLVLPNITSASSHHQRYIAILSTDALILSIIVLPSSPIHRPIVWPLWPLYFGARVHLT